MITTAVQPHQTKNGVLVFVEDQEHTKSFGYEWSSYPRVQTDSTLDSTLSKSRLELNLGFPLTFLAGMNVLELGSGPGRFTEHFAAHAKAVVAVDLSDAIFHNAALGKGNVLALKADLMRVPELTEPVDLVFCRGVIQHTRSPKDSLRKLFEYAPVGGLVIFDVYKKQPGDWRSFKYFWRPYFQKYWALPKFGDFLTHHGPFLYSVHHAWRRFLDAVPPLKWVLMYTPFFLTTNWDKEYGSLTQAQRLELFKADLIDALYAEYDQPMTPEEVLAVTASFGQMPYSYDMARNQFRYVKKEGSTPVKVRFTKNGALPV